MTSLLKDQLDEPYLKALPNAQSGRVRNRSTRFVCHTVRLFLDFCRTTHRSVFVLFLDLTKAFDFIVREFVMGRNNVIVAMFSLHWLISVCQRKTLLYLLRRLRSTGHS